MMLKTKMSDVRKDMEQSRLSGKKGGGAAKSFKIPRQGAGTVIVIGGPNSGKSQFVCSMTKATPEVAAYPFTTKIPTPGMMPWNDVFVQLIDTPPITTDFIEPYMYGYVRGAELVLLMVDLGDDDGIQACIDVLNRLQATKTRLAVESGLDEDDVGLSYTKTFVVANKIDLPDAQDRLALFHEFCPLDFREFVISSTDMTGVEDLRDAIYQSMNAIRVYTKQPQKKEADRDKPFTVKQGDTVLDLAEMIH